MSSSPKNIFRELSQKVADGEFELAYETLSGIDIMTINERNRSGFLTLLCRCLIHLEKRMELFELFLCFDMMSRDWIDFVLFLFRIEDDKKMFILNRMFEVIELKPKNISQLVNSGIPEILRFLVGKNVSMEGEGKEEEIFPDETVYTNFKKREINIHLDKINANCHDSVTSKIKKMSYDTVIDGGNVLFSNGGKDNKASFIRLKLVAESVTNPLIILHIRHKTKVSNYIPGLEKRIIYTPHGHNDDYYILFASLKKVKKIITKDNYGDHIDLFSVNSPNNSFLKNYLTEKICDYDFADGRVNVATPRTTCVYVKEDYIYVPVTSGGTVRIGI